MSINLLPWRMNEIQKQQRQYILFVTIFISIITMIFIGFHAFLNQKTAYLTTDTQTLKEKIEKIPLRSIQDNQALLKKLMELQLAKTKSDEKNNALEQYLSVLANDLPTTATLTSLILSEKQNTVTGESSALSDAHHYTEALQKDLKVKKLALSDVHNASQNKSLFNFSIAVSP